MNIVEIIEVRNYGLRKDHNFSSKLFQQFHNPYLFFILKDDWLIDKGVVQIVVMSLTSGLPLQ